MAKKLLTAIAALFLLFCFAACGGNPETHTVTFRQSGYEDVVKSVEHGEELTDVPLPRPKEGYEVVWDRTNFASITEDLVVTAVETPVPADCTVTFRQTGYDDIVKTVKRGEGLAPADIPAVRQKDGYTCVWQTVDFSVVTEDIVIFAVETPNVYVIFFELQTDEILEAGGVEITQLSVQYGKPYQLPTPEKIGYAFAGWNVKDSETKFADGVYLTLGNVTLTPNWTPDENGGWTGEYPGIEFVTVTFRQSGFDDIIRTVTKGETLTDIPQPQPREGFTVAWDRTDFSNVTANIVVNAVETLVESEYRSVTFRQNGYDDIVKTVKLGETLTDIPNVREKTGYDVAWDHTDFTAIRENLVVTAVETPKTFTLTYEIDHLEGWLIEEDSWTQSVTYDAAFTLKLPVHLEKKFLKWVTKGTDETFVAGVWNFTEDVTLTAVWIESESWTGEYPGEQYVLVVFREAGYPDIVKVLDVGETLTDIPSVHEETGYNVVWDRTDFENVTENLVVTAIKTPKSYTITYEIDDKTGWLIDGDSWEQTVRYGEEFVLMEPVHLEKKFLKWIIEGTQEEFVSGTWNCLEGVTLVAVWEESESWTGEYPGEN